jgi:hypothetical protein
LADANAVNGGRPRKLAVAPVKTIVPRPPGRQTTSRFPSDQKPAESSDTPGPLEKLRRHGPEIVGGIVACVKHHEIEAIGAIRLGPIEQRDDIRLNRRVGDNSLRLASVIDNAVNNAGELRFRAPGNNNLVSFARKAARERSAKALFGTNPHHDGGTLKRGHSRCPARLSRPQATTGFNLARLCVFTSGSLQIRWLSHNLPLARKILLTGRGIPELMLPSLQQCHC